MDRENANNPLSSSVLAKKLQRFKSIYRLIQEDNSPTLNEDAKVALKRDIENAAENIIRSHVKTLEEELLKPQEKKKCSKCGKWKKTWKVVVNVLDATRRFQYFGKHRQGDFHTQTHKITSSPPPLLLEGKPADSGGSQEVGQCRRQRQRDMSPSGSIVIQPTLMNFESRRGSCSDSSSSFGSGRSAGSVSSAAYSDSSLGYTSRGRHQRRRSLSRSPSTTSVESFASEAESSNDSGSDGSYDREQPHPRRRLDHHRDYDSRSPESDYGSRSPESDYSCKRRLTSRSRSPERDYPRRSRRSISRSISPEGRYLRRRGRRSSMVASSDHPNRSMGTLRRFTHKIGGMFHRRHPSDKDGNAQHHHRSIQHHASDGMVHCKSKYQTTAVKKKRNQKEGHFKRIIGGVVRHVRHSKESKPSTTDKKHLERAVTDKRKVKVEKLHWWSSARPRKSSSATKRLQIQGHRGRKK
ncbi:hypothetical protein MKW94_008650 [Papaver nudicaule]|uniref:Uncharacterized protein n=1 Tax=Papaver nudicaule TaxID=74823 RepID=A0AA41S0M2_PAPNU|nr:hypothetical protein [Papaver nudicaule]